MARIYSFEGIENFRDLGGYECRYGETQYGVAYRSATPIGATKRDLDKIASLDIKSVLDLRGKKIAEEQPSPLASDPRFEVSVLEVNGNGRVPQDDEDGLRSYLEMLEDGESASRILRAILHAERPLLIHCNAGKDRTGVFCALLLDLAGVDFPVINSDYMLSYPLLEKATAKVKDLLPPVCLTPTIYALSNVRREFLKRYGSVVAYLHEIGMSQDEVTSLSNLLGRQEKSCGAVVFHEGKILVEHMTLGHDSIPKGHVEEVDHHDDHATARREIKEETNLDVSFLDGFKRSSDYSPHDGVYKRVVWFAAEATSFNVKVQPEEVKEVLWLSEEEALNVLTHEDDKAIVRDAFAFYSSVR